MEHSTFANTIPLFSSNSSFATITPHWSALSILPLSSMIATLSPSPSKAAPKSALFRFTSVFKASKLASAGSEGLLGKEGSGFRNSASVFSFTRLITSSVTSPMLPFPQSSTIFLPSKMLPSNLFAMYSIYSSLKSIS